MADMINEAGATAEPADNAGAPQDQPPKSAKDWLEEIAQAERDMRPFADRCRKLQELYARQKKDGAADINGDRKFALLWSNIETLKPAVLAKGPKPVVRRRFADKDQVARYAGDILERALTTLFERSDIDGCVRMVRDDFLLVSRGTAWVRYVPSFKPQAFGAETVDVLSDETVAFDFVHWSDYLQPRCRMWKDLPWVGRRVFLDDERFKARFGAEMFQKLQASGKYASRRSKDGIAKSDKANICTYEVWSKRDQKVIWLARDCDFVLDEKPPLYNLHEFWPMPKPAFGTLATDSLVPVPDYVYYQDQAEEIDDLTRKIGALSDALKLVGFYPAAAEGETTSAIEKAINPLTGNELIPVPGWAAFVQGGGARDLVQWLPIDMVAKVLQGCIELRKQLIDDVYQITGISDILRGSTTASETATAQSIKAQWGSVRIRDRQSELARFCVDLTRISAEIVAERFQPETLWRLSGLTFPTAEQKRLLQQAIEAEAAPSPQDAAAQGLSGPSMPGQAPQMPELTDEMRKLATLPTQEEIVEFLHTDGVRSYRIEIETDSTVEPDEQAEKLARNEFLDVLTGFLERSASIASVAPQMIPVLGEALMFTVRGYRSGHQLEDVVQQAVDEMMEQAKAAASQPKQDDPAATLDRERFEAEKAEKEARLAVDRAEKEGALAVSKQEAEAKIALERENAARAHALRVAEHNRVLMESTGGDPTAIDAMGGVVSSQNALLGGQQQLLAGQEQLAMAIGRLVEIISAPKVSQVIRGPDGFATGVVTTPQIPEPNAPTTAAVQ